MCVDIIANRATTLAIPFFFFLIAIQSDEFDVIRYDVNFRNFKPNWETNLKLKHLSTFQGKVHPLMDHFETLHYATLV